MIVARTRRWASPTRRGAARCRTPSGGARANTRSASSSRRDPVPPSRATRRPPQPARATHERAPSNRLCPVSLSFLVSSPPTPRLVRAFRFRPVSVLTPVSPSVSLSPPRPPSVCRLSSRLPSCLLTTITTAICCPSSFASPCPPPICLFFPPPRIVPFSGFALVAIVISVISSYSTPVFTPTPNLLYHLSPLLSLPTSLTLVSYLTSRARVPPPTRRLAHITHHTQLYVYKVYT